MKTVVGSSLVSRVAAWLNPYSPSVMTNGEIRTSRTKPEVVQIGAPGVYIARVTQKRIEYVDMKGQEQFIDLEECARNWVRWYDDHNQEFISMPGVSKTEIDAENARCVGQRGGGSQPVYWVAFMNERKTRFEFRTWQALWRQLQVPLIEAGWGTFDTE